jgi:hypothetical protein
MKHADNDIDIEDEDFLTHLSENDFIFVVNCDGELKTILVPEEFDASQTTLPPNIQKMFQIFGITDLTNQTLH